MGTLIDLSVARGRRQSEERPKPARDAEIMLFTGVRYERWADETASAGEPVARKAVEKQ